MKFILVTPPENVSQERETILYFLEGEMGVLHVRKPGWSDEDLTEYLSQFPKKYYQNISIHGSMRLAENLGLGGIHHRSTDQKESVTKNWNGRLSRSTHTFDEVRQFENEYDYLFLGPVFDSISKEGYQSNFDRNRLSEFLSQKHACEIVALGGINASNAFECTALGFDGVAILGAVWSKNDFNERVAELDAIGKKLQLEITV